MDQNGSAAELTVSATVARRNRATETLETCSHDAKEFLGQILADERKWYPPRTQGLPDSVRGCWVLKNDLDRVLAFMRQRDEDEWLLRRDEEAGWLLRVRPELAVISDQVVSPAPEQMSSKTEQLSPIAPETQPAPTKETAASERVERPATTGKVKTPTLWARLIDWFGRRGG